MHSNVQNAKYKKKYFHVSVDISSGWPNAIILPGPTGDKVFEVLQ